MCSRALVIVCACLVACGRDPAGDAAERSSAGADALGAAVPAGPSASAEPLACSTIERAHQDRLDAPVVFPREHFCLGAKAPAGRWRASLPITVPAGIEVVRVFGVELDKVTPKVLERAWFGEGRATSEAARGIVGSRDVPADLPGGATSTLVLEGDYRLMSNEEPESKATLHVVVRTQIGDRPFELPVSIHVSTGHAPEVSGPRPRAPPGEPDKVPEP